MTKMILIEEEKVLQTLEALEFYDKQGIGRIPGAKVIAALREALAEPRIEDNEIKNYLQTVASNNGYAHDNPRIYEIFCEVFAAGAKWQRDKTPVKAANGIIGETK